MIKLKEILNEGKGKGKSTIDGIYNIFTKHHKNGEGHAFGVTVHIHKYIDKRGMQLVIVGADPYQFGILVIDIINDSEMEIEVDKKVIYKGKPNVKKAMSIIKTKVFDPIF